MTRGLLYSQDPGGASVLAPLAARLGAAPDALRGPLASAADEPELVVAVHPLSAPAFERSVVRGHPLSAWFDTIPVTESDLRRWLARHGITHVICSLSSRYRDLTNCRLITAARAEGVPTLGFLDAWVGFDRFVDDHGHAVYLPDVIGCIDEYCRDRLLALGMPASTIHVVGQPHLETMLATGVPRPEGGGPVRLLLVSQPVVKDRSFRGIYESPCDDTRLLDHIAAVCAAVGRDHRLVADLRPHPKERPGAAPPPAPIRLDERPPSAELHRDHDVLVGLNSMVLVEAALAGRVVIRLRVPELDDAVDELDLPFEFGLTVRALRSLDEVMREAIIIAGSGTPPPGQRLPDLAGSLARTVALARRFLTSGQTSPSPCAH